jgi:hypothetical protein
VRPDLEAALHVAAVSALERLADCFVEPATTSPNGVLATEGIASVRFRGPARGRVALRLQGGILPTIAANMLGRDTTPGSSVERDALGELANVICGSVLPALAGPSATFILEPPRLDEAWAAGPNSTCVASASLAVDRGRADIMLLIDEMPPNMAA